MTSSFLVVYVTTPVGQKAKAIAAALVKERLAACVNILPSVWSVYWWEGRMQSGQEALLVIKTHKKKFKTLVKKIRAIHPYKVPEIIALPIIQGNQAYLNWIKAETK